MLGMVIVRYFLLVWAYQVSNSATIVALLSFFNYVPYILISPVAGILCDRVDRRLVLLFGDVGAGLTISALLIVNASSELQAWHFFLTEFGLGIFEAFQVNAYSIIITTLVSSEQYTRANGMRSLAESGSSVLAPILGGLLLGFLKTEWLVTVGIVTTLAATAALLLVRVPPPLSTEEGKHASGSFWHEARYGFSFIFRRRGLCYLMLEFTAINLMAAITYYSILPAMILARSGGEEMALGLVQSALGIGGVIGAIAISAWGGPKRKIHSVLLGAAISFTFGDLFLAIGRSLPFWVIAAIASSLTIPFIVSTNTAIWQSCVPADIQGKVFAARNLVTITVMPLGFLISGPLADRVFEPAMAGGGNLAQAFGWLIGTGPGAGMALMFICTGILGTLFSLGGYLIPDLVHVEDAVPAADLAGEILP